MVKISMRGNCKNIQFTPKNGEPARGMVRVELDHNVSPAFHLFDIQLFVPTEFASLLEIGIPVTITLEQNGG